MPKISSKLIIFLIFLLAVVSVNAKTRIKDITTKEGDRENILVGHGLVVGLSGTGDNLKNAVFTEKGLTDFLERLGINVQGANLKTKNIAAVTVTAKLPAFARRGNKISVQVSAIGDARSLRGGTLLATPLLGADGDVYALAQGRIAIADFNPVSADVKNKSQTVETNGYIQDGAIVETEIPYEFASQTRLRFSLHSPDFSTAIKVAEVINDHIPGNTAKAIDAATIEVHIPSYKQTEMIDFVADIETLTVEPDYKAKIVIDEATGTIVIGNNVSIAPVAIAHGNLIVNVGQLKYDQQYGPDTPEDERDLINSYVDQKRGRSVHHLQNNASLNDLVDGLNKLGVYPRDMIDILRNMKSVGALNAVIEVK